MLQIIKTLYIYTRNRYWFWSHKFLLDFVLLAFAFWTAGNIETQKMETNFEEPAKYN